MTRMSEDQLTALLARTGAKGKTNTADTSSVPFREGHRSVPDDPTPADLMRAYDRLGSIYKVGEVFGLRGNTVHARLIRAGLWKPQEPEFTEAQSARIREYYETTPVLDFDLSKLSTELGKHKTSVCGHAKKLGLTNSARPAGSLALSKSRRPKWQDKPHPRGMAGKKHTPETLKKVSAASIRNWNTWKTFSIGPMEPAAREINAERLRKIRLDPSSIKRSRTRGSHRSDLGDVFFRSSWEANYARYLNLLVKMKVVDSWEFEPETFWFENIKRGVRSYLVDFKVQYAGELKPVYVEVKGWMDPKSKTKIARFRKYYPQHKLEIVGEKEYRSIQKKWASAIPNWETAKSSRRTK